MCPRLWLRYSCTSQTLSPVMTAKGGVNPVLRAGTQGDEAKTGVSANSEPTLLPPSPGAPTTTRVSPAARTRQLQLGEGKRSQSLGAALPLPGGQLRGLHEGRAPAPFVPLQNRPAPSPGLTAGDSRGLLPTARGPLPAAHRPSPAAPVIIVRKRTSKPNFKCSLIKWSQSPAPHLQLKL